ncbi:SpaA isopeptide-forming pilin-related protein, partial [Paratractidigestivibacter faecalis]|uniref:SpaA isopeptide-forming pilin-related protein n=1 Tax=Paratractidigestivibacter faecalis TaxID=2292441 RepID=UPI00388FCECD
SGEYEDFYQVWYDNSTAPNHGDDTSALFNGGTLIVTHAGTTHFSASKRWFDDNAGSRPTTHYSLWRFSVGTGSYVTATQVRVGDGNVPVEFDVSAEENAAAGNGTIDLGQKVMDLVSAQDGSLAKYDPDGVPYVYELREDAPDNDYERLNGTGVDQETGNPVGDVSPNYYKPDGKETTTVSDDFARSGADKGVYNGGTLINRRSAKQQVSVTKTWNAGAFQDQLRDVTVTFKLQRILKRHAKQDGGLWVSKHDPIDPDDPSMGTYEWNDDIDGKVVVDEVSDWYAEKLTQSISGTYNRYDHNGEEWVYRWVEVNVKGPAQDPVQGSSGFSDEATAKSRFPLWLTDAEGNEETVMFQGSYDPETGTIVNSYVNQTDQHVDKLWAVIDASGNVVLDKDGNPAYTQDAKPNGHDAPPVTMRIFRDGSPYGTAVLDGVVDDDPTNLVGDGADGGTAQETSPWHLDLNNLPKYDDEGREYTYLVLEEEVRGYGSRREYDPETRTTTIRNTPVGSGDVSIARVTKTWADDGNSTSRTPVLVGVYADRQITGANGVSYAKDQLIGTVELNASHGWYGEFSIPVGGLSYGNGFYVREISQNPADGTEYEYDVLTRSEAELSQDADIKNSLLNWPENNPDNLWNEVLFSKSEPSEDNTGKFAYRVSYGYNNEVGAACVTNLRVGQVWISLQKNWEDLGADPAKRPSAFYVISCDEISNVFHADENGYVYATLGQNAPAQYVRNGKPGADGVEGIMRVGDDGVQLESESGNLIVPVSRDGSCQAHVDALPKYDEAGAIVHYRVTERWDGERGDYQSSQTGYSEDYSSRWHGCDRLSYSFTNRRSETKDVTFHMKWYDAYVKEELNQRPDIYLTVYRTVYLYDEDGNPVYNSDGSPAFTTEVVTGYENYKWRPNAEEGKDARYNEYAVIGDLPKYDEHGREIVYYASASTSTSTESLADLDYQSTWFTYSAKDADPGNHGWDEADSEVSAADKRVLVGTATGKGDDGYAVREDGTFNFRIESNLIVRGFKHWMNLPGNFDDSADLPALSVYLQRRLAGGTYDASGAWQAGDPVDWSDLSVSGSDTNYKVKDYSTEGEDVADGQTAVAWARGLTRVNANLYEFLLTHFGRNNIGETEDSNLAALPKYDSNGRCYEYRVQEVVDGLLPNGGSSVPGGTWPGSGKPGGSVFTPIYDTNSYSISNVYNSQKGRLTVKKLYDGRQKGDKFPSVAFRLYRYYVKSDGTKSGAEQVGTKVLRSSDVKEVDDGSRGTGTVAFDGLDIYVPSGQYWIYYVTESEIDGYVESVGLGDLGFDADGSNWSRDWSLNDCTSADLVSGMKLQPDNRSFSQPTHSAVADDDTVDVTFKNTYDDQVTTKLTGTKRWYDQGNAFGTRPDDVTLRLVRTYQDGTPDAGTGNADGEVTLQVTDLDSPNYLSWEKPAGSDTWSYTIQNVERFAPDGKPWRYTVSETSTGSDQYSVSGSSRGGTVSAGTGSALPLIANYLKTKVDVTKAWADSDDPWLQRPDVYVGLQLRYRADGGTSWSDWAGAEDALASLGVTAADGSRLTSLSGKEKLDASNNWSFEWNDVPTEAKVSGTAYSLEWRAVETCLVYDPGAGEDSVTVDLDSPGIDGRYAIYQPYQPSQSTDKTANGQGDTVFKTVVTNKLSETSVSATKSWQDESNKWGSRPGTTGDADRWSVTYVLQRTTGDPANEGAVWSWVSKYGAPVADDAALDASGNLNELLLEAAIEGSGDSATASFDHLPASDPKGNTYSYRLVELVRGSYDVHGTTVASTADRRVRLVTVPTAVGGQQFSNVLLSVSVSGRKLWNDFGAGLVPPFSATPNVRLQLQSSVDGKGWTAVKRADGQAVVPVWTQNGPFDWTFTYNGLPKTDQQGRTYQYRVREVGDASNGFVDSYGNDASVDAGTGNVTTATITNTATRFSLEKLGDGTTGSDGEKLAGVTLKVRGASSGRTYAVWTRDLDDSGNLVTRSYVCPAGVAEAADALTNLTPGNGFIEMTGENAGLVIGLHVGKYKVHESRVPDGHLRAADATFVLGRDGSIAGLAGATMEVRSNNVGYVTMVDPVLRGNVELYKYYMHDGAEVVLPGMTFDLYKGDVSQPESAVLLATGITTGSAKTDGAVRTYLWTSGPLGAGNDKIAIKHDTNGNSVLGKYFQTLYDGLPEGSYFLKETGESHLVESSQKSFSFTISAAAGATTQPLYKWLKADNVEFNATATLKKVDSETGKPVNGATFELLYQAPDASSYVTVPSGLQTGSAFQTGSAYAGNASGTSFTRTGSADDGRLAISGLKKGSYRLVEVSNRGYSVDDESKPTASWTITNDDQGQTIDLAADGQPKVSWTGAEPSGGTLANKPLHADVLLTKKDSRTSAVLDGVGFTLQRKEGEDFVDVSSVGALLTGRAYALTVDSDGTIIGAAEVADQAVSGQLKVSNLLWGTYRLVETGALPGYASAEVDGAPVVREFTVDRQSFAESASGPTIDLEGVSNRQTDLIIRKANADGTASLSGATFTLSGTFADGSTKKTLVAGDEGLAVPATEADAVRGQLLVGKSYKLTETVPPNGYGLPSPASVTLTVAADGSLTSNDAEGTAFVLASADGLTTVTAKDAPTRVMLRKVDQNGKPLLGASFTVRGNFSDGTHEKTVSPAGPNAVFVSEGHLVAGEAYKISETGIPAGYTRVSDAEFRVADDGKSVVLTGSYAGWSVADDGLTITAQDQPVRLTLAKRSTDGNALGGALFSIAGVFADGQGHLLNEGQATTREGLDVSALSALNFVQGQTYELEETQAPAGFELISGKLKFSVDKDGKATLDLSGVSNGGYALSDDGVAITATDEPVRLSFAKADGSGHVLEGALFSVTGVFSDGEGHLLNGGQPVTFSDRDVRGLSELNFVQGQIYQLEETQAPAGYELISGKLGLTVGTDGKATLDLSGVSNGGWSVSADGVAITASDLPIAVSLAKAGEKGEPLAGATFAIRPHDGGTLADGSSELTLTTGSDGRASVSGLLVAGRTYEVEETEAPEGHKRLSGTILVAANADGTVTAVDPQAGISNGAFEVTGDTITVTDEAVPFSITKYGTDDNGRIDTGLPLSGARFTVAGAFAGDDGQSSVELVTGQDGKAGSELAGRLVAGRTYVIRETKAPDGYTLVDGSLEVLVNADGTLSLVGELPARYRLSEDGFAIEAADAPIEASVAKVSSADGKTPLAGAAFTLSCADGANEAGESNHFANGSSTDVYELLTGEDGTAQIPTAALVAGNSYELEETVAPAGYALVSGPLTLSVAADGTLELLAGPAAYELLPDGQVGVRLADEPTRLTIAKAASDGAPASAMAGASFEVTPEEGYAFFDGTTEARLLTIGEDGLAPELVGVLDTDAVYVVREVRAPAGYALLDGEARVAVRQDGSVVAAPEDGQLPAGWSFGEKGGRLRLTATDDPLPESEPETPAEPREPGTSSDGGAAPFTGDATSSTVACLILAGGLALVASGLRRRRRRG